MRAPSIHDGKPVLQGVRALALRAQDKEVVSAGADGSILVWAVAGPAGPGLSGPLEKVQVRGRGGGLVVAWWWPGERSR